MPTKLNLQQTNQRLENCPVKRLQLYRDNTTGKIYQITAIAWDANPEKECVVVHYQEVDEKKTAIAVPKTCTLKEFQQKKLEEVYFG